MGYQRRVHGELFPDQWPSSNSRWARAKMRAGSPRSSCRCTRTASSLWTSTRMASWTRTTSVEPSTTSVCSCPSPSSTVCWARSLDLAPMTTWSRCSRRRWPARATTPTTSSSRPSRPTTTRARLTPRCSSTLKTWGDKVTKAEIDDIFGEFEIDEDYMIKTKDVIGLFVSVKEEPKVEEPAPVEEVEAEPEEDADAKKKKKKKKKAAK